MNRSVKTFVAAIALFAVAPAASQECGAMLDITMDGSDVSAGKPVRFVVESDFAPGTTFEWSLDGLPLWTSDSPTLEVLFPSGGTAELDVRAARDQTCIGSGSLTVQPSAPRLDRVVGLSVPPVEVCGDGDDVMEPGERWRVRSPFANIGAAFPPGGYALFLPTEEAADSVVLHTPAVPLGEVQSEEHITIPYEFTILPDAECGSQVGFLYHGAVAPGLSLPSVPEPGFGTAIGASDCDVVGTCPVPASGVKRGGLLYDPARPGNGLLGFVHNVDNEATFGGIWYTALEDRSPVWYTLQGAWRDTYAAVPVRRFSASFSSGALSTTFAEIGSARVAWASPSSVVVAWEFESGERGLELVQAEGLPHAVPNHSQLWFAPSDPGWGHGIETLAAPTGERVEFWATFFYDLSGAPRWAVGGADQLTGVVTLKTHHIHCPDCAYVVGQLDRDLPAGSHMRQFNSSTAGELETAINVSSPFEAMWQRSLQRIEPISPPRP